MKVEEFTDVEEEEEEEPVPITCPVIETEHEVSCICMYIIIHISQISIVAYFYSCFHSGEWNLRSALKNVEEVLLVCLIKCCMENGKAKYIFSQFLVMILIVTEMGICTKPLSTGCNAKLL
jgi:hypothetical protein